jgi:hypothetical protein
MKAWKNQPLLKPWSSFGQGNMQVQLIQLIQDNSGPNLARPPLPNLVRVKGAARAGAVVAVVREQEKAREGGGAGEKSTPPGNHQTFP